MITVGTAAWALPRAARGRFPSAGSLLQRYAAVFPGVEINSTFYHSHKPETFARWADAVPPAFRFAVKMRGVITHDEKLAGDGAELERFLGEIRPLGEKLGPILVQLPPRLAYNKQVADAFFTRLRDHFDGDVALEPRHASWFSEPVDALLKNQRISRVSVDHQTGPGSDQPGGFEEFVYFRFHGSPKIYFSDYDADQLGNIVRELRASAAQRIWCIFDNTGLGHATSNALSVLAALQDHPRVCGREPQAL